MDTPILGPYIAWILTAFVIALAILSYTWLSGRAEAGIQSTTGTVASKRIDASWAIANVVSRQP